MKVRVSTRLRCAPDAAWEAVQTTALLERVAWPLLHFVAVGPGPLPERWVEGKSSTVSMFVFGVVPIGHHTIRIVRLDPGRRVLETRESGRLAPVWNHRIEVAGDGPGRAIYSDEVEIHAGWRTPGVWLLARLFYRYHQWRWRRLAPALRARAAGRAAAAARDSL